MQINAEYRNNVLYITPIGEMDEHSAREARWMADKLADEHARSERAVFDLAQVSFMDSTGIGFLIGRYKKFRRYGVPTYITGVTQSLDKILSMSGVYTLMPRI